MHDEECVHEAYLRTHTQSSLTPDSTEVNLSQREQLFGGHLVVWVSPAELQETMTGRKQAGGE